MRSVLLLAAISAVVTGQLPAQATATNPTTAATTQASAVDQAIAALREKGMPATYEDLRATPLPDEKNGVVDILAAAKLMVPEKSGPSSSSLDYGEQLPYPPEWHRLAEENVQAHAEMHTLMRKARQKGGIAWNDEPKAPFTEGYWRGFSDLRAIANSLDDAALYAHVKGDDAQAIAVVMDLGFLADAVNKRPFLISKLVGIGISAIRTHTIQIISTQVKIGHGEKAAPREAVTALIAELLDDERIKELYRIAIREERTMMIEEIRGGASIPMRAIAYAQLPKTLEAYDAMIAAADRPAWDQTQITGGVLTQTLAPIDRVRQPIWKQILVRRIAAVSLAAAMYRNDHGSYPATLNDLVPAYIPAIPADPYARDGSPLFYRLAEGGRRPLLGSVGPDGQEAADAPLPPEPHYGIYSAGPGEPDDIWIDLAAWNPAKQQ